MTRKTSPTRARRTLAVLACLFAAAPAAHAQLTRDKPAKLPVPAAPDLTKTPTLYTVGYAHLDTEWNWDYPTTISQYLPKTMHDNFVLFEKYPDYVFNFSGANRYRMMKEYYPADYARLKQYVAAGRWFPAGSSMEEGDVNAPSAEAIMREILYGNDYFRKEFGKASAEYMLPDCFGFPWSLPSILAHAGVKGFSTQKLTWGSSAPDQASTPAGQAGKGIPFNIGVWEGPDGKSVLAALNPGSYSGRVTNDLSNSMEWINRVQTNGLLYGVFTDYHYYGTGDTGGSPRDFAIPNPQYARDSSVWYIEQATRASGQIAVRSANADQMFLDIKPDQEARLPRYSGEMELQEHSAGSLTSETYRKRWNRMNEVLADAAEKASVAAEWLGARKYPQQRLNDAWTLVMGGHFHDIMAGTAIPRAYQYSWNDDVIAMNQFASVLTSATDAVASALDTRTQGTAVVVYNSLNIAREDVVEATVTIAGGTPKAVRVFGPDGQEVPAQLDGGANGSANVVFVARVPSAGYAVYDVRGADAPATSTISVAASSLENARYRITVDQNGDLSGVFDKTLNKELLSAPARLAFQANNPTNWPAWNMYWQDQRKPPRGYVNGPARLTVTEKGPARVALTIERKVDSSTYVQTIRLSAGDGGNRVEFRDVIDWKTEATALKATFPLTASNPDATYNWDVGTITRGNDYERKFEVPSHQWFDLTDRSGAFGVTILSDDKNASDKPDDNTLRLTLLYSPGITPGGRQYAVQASQDWGHHEFVYGLASHAGDWRKEQTDWQGYRLNEPLVAFESPKHAGALGKTFSLVKLNNSRVRVMAVKKAENSDELVVRMNEIDGKPQQNVRVTFAAPIVAAREINGQEQPLGPATVSNGELVTSFTPYTIRSFAVRLAAVTTHVAPPTWQPVTLAYDLAAASNDSTKSAGGFNAKGDALPAEMLPRELPYAGISFRLAPAKTGAPNATVARGQSIAIPPGKFTKLYILAASSDGDQNAAFRVGDQAESVVVEDWGGFVGQWDTRLWKRVEVPPDTTGRGGRGGGGGGGRGGPPQARMVDVLNGITPGVIKRAPVAWYASHHHTADGANVPYEYSYLFAYVFDVPAGAKTFTLPNNDRIRVLAATAANEAPAATPAQPLYDTLNRNPR